MRQVQAQVDYLVRCCTKSSQGAKAENRLVRWRSTRVAAMSSGFAKRNRGKERPRRSRRLELQSRWRATPRPAAPLRPTWSPSAFPNPSCRVGKRRRSRSSEPARSDPRPPLKNANRRRCSKRLRQRGPSKRRSARPRRCSSCQQSAPQAASPAEAPRHMRRSRYPKRAKLRCG